MKVTTEIKLSLVLLLTLSLVVSGVIWYQLYPHQDSHETDPTLEAGQQGKIPTIDAFFSTKTIEDPQVIQVTVPIKFSDVEYPVWLYLLAADPHPTYESLVYHPTLAQLKWPMLKNERYTLFQKDPQFDSIDAFLSAVNKLDRLMVDPSLVAEFDLNESQVTTINDEALDLTDIDFVFTTFAPPIMQDGYLSYQTTFDARHAKLNAENALSWQLKAPQASQEHPYFIGNIYVDYNEVL